MTYGYMGKYCIIDLKSGNIETVKPEEKFYQKLLGGYGIGAAVISRRQKAGIDPLSSDSYLGFCPGLLTGTGAFFSGRFMVVGKSPLTGGWGDANAGGFFAVELKKTGYDAIFITGKSEEPVWIQVTNDKIEIHSAGDLWGLDTVATEEKISELSGDARIRVACIGASGEKCSLISGVVTGGRESQPVQVSVPSWAPKT